MKQRKDWILALALSIVVSLLTLIPYLLANRIAEPLDFNGFLINPLDGHSYLAKMRQGASGSWLFQLMYTPQASKGAFIFVYYLLLGHIADLLGVPLIYMFHAARVIASVGMFFLVYVFFYLTIPKRRARWTAFFVALFGSGIGWLFAAFGVEGSDLWIPESIPFLTAYTNAHFPLATAAFLAAVITMIWPGRSNFQVVVATLSGLCLGAVLPFSLISLLGILALWLAWEVRVDGFVSFWIERRLRIYTLIGLLAGALPWLLYDFWLSQTHPTLKLWSAQNQTPSPPFFNYLIGYGLIIILAIFQYLMMRSDLQSRDRLYLSWILITLLLLYAPLPFQRRLTLGLFFPLAGSAALGLERIIMRQRNPFAVMTLLFILVIPSNILVMGAGLRGVREGRMAVVHLPGELDAYKWLDENVTSGSLVLASPDTGNRLPAYSAVRVLYGHPFETPRAREQERTVRSLFIEVDQVEDGVEQLIDQGIAYVFYGPREQDLGHPKWLTDLTEVYRSGEVQILRVNQP